VIEDGGHRKINRGTWEARRSGNRPRQAGINNRLHDSGRESAGFIVAWKRDNARGAKGPCRIRVNVKERECRLDHDPTTEQPEGLGERPELGRRRALPEKLSLLRQKLGHKAKQQPKFRFYALYDRIYRSDTLRAVYDADLQGYFDSIPRAKLMACLEMRIGPLSRFASEARCGMAAGILDGSDDQSGEDAGGGLTERYALRDRSKINGPTIFRCVYNSMVWYHRARSM